MSTYINTLTTCAPSWCCYAYEYCLCNSFGAHKPNQVSCPFAIWIAYCFVDECWMNRYTVLCSICNAFCYCKLFDVSYSNKVILNWKLKHPLVSLYCTMFHNSPLEILMHASFQTLLVFIHDWQYLITITTPGVRFYIRTVFSGIECPL